MKKSKSVVASKFWELTIATPPSGALEGTMLRPNLTTFRVFAYDRHDIIKWARNDKASYYHQPIKEVISI